MCCNLRFLSIVIVFLVGGSTVFAQQKTKRVCDTIPYEYIHDKIVIPVIVNGVKVKYIVDTGGQTGTMWEYAQEMGAKATGATTNISDLNGVGQNFQMATVENVELGPNYKLAELKTMVLGTVGFFEDLEVAGILGGDAFAQSVITFDSRKQIMVINYPYRPEGLKVTDGVEMFTGNTHHSIVNMDFGGVEKQVLFDTGAQGFLIIPKNDFQDLQQRGVCEEVAKAYGISGVGLAGLSDPGDIYKGNIREMTFLGKRFSDVGCVTSIGNTTIIGVDLLKYGKVVLDYMRKRFYFFPFDDSVQDMGGAPKTWNVGILPANGRFEVTTVWESMKDEVSFGDQVVDINGTSLANLPMSQLEIDKIMNAIEGDTGYIIVVKEGKEKKIEIRRER
ncbi:MULTISPECIES: aspartyl protease family protein [Butyricimonas]|uniref:aspartyl protease family protein n=1 Tax=Butyricimonas TaxID=574697 RepID=UPI0007FB2353|nr:MULTISPECIES: aspartyl protease family protein [Butyricimonas]